MSTTYALLCSNKQNAIYKCTEAIQKLRVAFKLESMAPLIGKRKKWCRIRDFLLMEWIDDDINAKVDEGTFAGLGVVVGLLTLTFDLGVGKRKSLGSKQGLPDELHGIPLFLGFCQGSWW